MYMYIFKYPGRGGKVFTMNFRSSFLSLSIDNSRYNVDIETKETGEGKGGKRGKEGRGLASYLALPLQRSNC